MAFMYCVVGLLYSSEMKFWLQNQSVTQLLFLTISFKCSFKICDYSRTLEQHSL